ncbi:MAG: acyl carrier protein [Acidimicrobiia bacterium]|nr:acyl carrier protein [Acidimicrobiia bacterium]MDH5237850.1 acyl carrier protein [Acidimicrobiia bacterium]
MTIALADRLIELIRTEINPAAGDDLGPDTDLLLTGLVDSLGVVRVVNWIEDEMGVEVDPVDVTLENFQTVNAMAAYIGRQADR